MKKLTNERAKYDIQVQEKDAVINKLQIELKSLKDELSNDSDVKHLDLGDIVKVSPRSTVEGANIGNIFAKDRITLMG